MASYMKQTKKRKQTLESAPYELDISFNAVPFSEFEHSKQDRQRNHRLRGSDKRAKRAVQNGAK